MLQTGTDMPTPRRPRKSGTKEPAKIQTEEDETPETGKEVFRKNRRLLKYAFDTKPDRNRFPRPCQFCGRDHITLRVTTYVENEDAQFIVRAALCEGRRDRWSVYPIDVHKVNSRRVYRADGTALKRTVGGLTLREAQDVLREWAETVVQIWFGRKIG